ncbi:MAG: amino acid-binding protein [Deltaproteobacteria bacterium]|nr:amino acid-binding protein [Deltaproteobacteria bacterium]MBW1738802.1 amino acid-binding protein [Deltaproteobacteria bacterium]MBW1909184.1 amino acid-binding protein [Deltaproteobacteria bacterium]MBW2033255.1 amino acid-binding protein [Deltaproteobacteria bacterium]MBW2114902.1 amino acid-binding protein [Deltaproteobacteria bacterium]
MVRTEISLFLENVPGELGKLTSMLSAERINIDALTIQDASKYVQELFKARGKSLNRIAPAASYGSMQKDSADHALIRLLVDKTDKAIDLLSRSDYVFDIMPVIALEIENRPGTLSEMAKKFGEEGININYVYGSALPGGKRSLFIFCPEDIELAAKIFKD